MSNFEKVEYGFWKQTDPVPFEYSLEYKEKQSTNSEMSYLRLGWLLSHISMDELKTFTAVDIGCGNGVFIKTAKNHFGRLVGFDVNGISITEEELYSTEWDLIILSDVLEHFEDINDLYKIKWKNAFISFPETPDVEDQHELSKWRHYKPNEHLWCLTLTGVCNWLADNNCDVIGKGCFEDAIRTRWNDSKVNISSILTKRGE